MAKKRTKTNASLLVAAAVASVQEKQDTRNHTSNNNDTDFDDSIPASSTDHRRHDVVQRVVVDVLTVRLLSTVGKSSSLHRQARLLVSSHDAIQLNVSMGEYVILLSLDNDEDGDDNNETRNTESNDCIHKDSHSQNRRRRCRIKALAILPIEIHHDKATVGGSGTPSSSPILIRRTNLSQQKQKRSPGVIQLTSSAVLEYFVSSSSSSINQSMNNLSIAGNDTNATLSTAANTTTTPSNIATTNSVSPTTPRSESTATTTKFSFKSMVVASPRPVSSSKSSSSSKWQTPRSSSTTSVNNNSKQSGSGTKTNTAATARECVKMIPCHTALGTFIVQSRTLPCIQLVVEPIEFVTNNEPNDYGNPTILFDSSSSMPQNLVASTSMNQTLERLIRVHIMESFVMIGQQFRISFTGKPFYFKIIDATTTKITDTDRPCHNANHDVRRPDNTNTSNCTIRQLDDEFSRLHIQNNCNDETKELHAAILNSNIQLYQVLRSTQIILSNQGKEKQSVEEMGHDTTNNMPIARPLQSPQYVAGLSATMDELRSLLYTPLRRPELFTSRGMNIPRGVLLHGPNGVGKTGLAKQFLAEVGATLNCHTQYIHCTSLQSKSDIVGEAESVLSKLFRPTTTTTGIRSTTPSLLVLDDIHLICSKRGNGGSSQGMDRLASTLLALMDGIEGNNTPNPNLRSSSSSAAAGHVVVLAITTNPSILDSALRRPGRLDAEVEVPLPEDASSRAEIIQFHVSNFGIARGDDLQEPCDFLDIAKAANGFNGADCMLAVKEAIRFAIVETTETEIVLRKHHLLTAMRSIKPSAIKSITVEIPQVLWSSIGGMDSVKRDLREAIELPLSHSEYFEQLRVPPPRGILLYGPPGCSKTLMARALATEGNMNFLAVKGPELLSKWLGESERALSSLFRRARMASPAIIFFDEIDAIASKRGSGDSASSGRLLSQMLTELDGVSHTGGNMVGSHQSTKTKSKQHRVVVVGATNRPDLLDTALTRPGRIDRMIYVGPPDTASRAQILQITLQKSFCNWNDIDTTQLASDKVSGGFSGAEMVAICRDAALLALEESDGNDPDDVGKQLPMIEMRHLLTAIKNMQRQITPSMIDFYRTYQESYHRNNG